MEIFPFLMNDLLKCGVIGNISGSEPEDLKVRLLPLQPIYNGYLY